MSHSPLMNILYVMYGMLLGSIIVSAIAKRRRAKEIRSKFLKITETYTLTIADFAGKEVSLERFCDKLFGPEAYYQKDPRTIKLEKRNWLFAILLLFLATIAVLAAIYFN